VGQNGHGRGVKITGDQYLTVLLIMESNSISDATQLGNNTGPKMSSFTDIALSENDDYSNIRPAGLAATPRRKERA
jgi:hypothetical protein